MVGPGRADRPGRSGAGAAALILAFASLAAAGAPTVTEPTLPGDVEAVDLNRFRLTLGTAAPYRFRLHYHGPTMPFRGPVCYAFAGYNETCRDPHIRWLTPATVIDLWAPGGVPRDLLEGYTILVRFPALSERGYRFTLEEHPGRGDSR